MKQLTPISIARTVSVTSILALSPLAIAPAQAAVLNFNSPGGSSNNLAIGTTYTEAGFRLTTTGAGFGTYGTLSTNYVTSPALHSRDENATITLSNVSGISFSLTSIDLNHQQRLNTLNVAAIAFTGKKADNSIVTQSFNIDTAFNTFQTFTFNNTFKDLVSVSWDQGSGPRLVHQFDNIVATPTPEPFTILGTLLGLGSTVALKRKLAATRSDDNDLN